MTPRVNRHSVPNIQELDEYAFQDLCNEILDREETVSKSSVYGRRGQAQRGIDLLALRKDAGIEVAQCKCEKSYTVAKVQRVSREFWDKWAHWKNEGVKRFILFVACEITDTKINDEELAQRKEFAKNGIDYEIWDGAVIRNKLRPHRVIAQAYIDSEEIVEDIK